MLTMLINMSMPWAPSTWRIWVDHIMKQRKAFGLKKAAIVRGNGVTASGTPGFILSQQDVLKIKATFENPTEHEAVRVKGKTYIIKCIDQQQIVAFNGAKYLIICRSKTMFVVVQCNSRNLSEDAARWLRRVNARLIEKDF